MLNDKENKILDRMILCKDYNQANELLRQLRYDGKLTLQPLIKFYNLLVENNEMDTLSCFARDFKNFLGFESYAIEGMNCVIKGGTDYDIYSFACYSEEQFFVKAVMHELLKRNQIGYMMELMKNISANQIDYLNEFLPLILKRDLEKSANLSYNITELIHELFYMASDEIDVFITPLLRLLVTVGRKEDFEKTDYIFKEFKQGHLLTFL